MEQKKEFVDPNFVRQDSVSEDDTQWYDARELSLYGLMPDKEHLCRMPKAIAATVNPGVLSGSIRSTGGRVRFSTDSPFIALRVEYGKGAVPTCANHCLCYGFDLYRTDEETEVFTGVARPVNDFDYKTGAYKMKTRRGGQMTAYTLNLPVFTAVKGLQIGIQKGCAMGPGKAYRNEKPVIFYGNSLTNGAAASRPGNTYESFISQAYNLDYRNLGFAGSAKGEQTMAEFIAGLPMCVFVCDYDHNAPTLEHYKATHYAFYETIRKRQPDVPYIMLSRPTYFMDPVVGEQRKKVTLESYESALANGDRNVYFVDGATLYEGDFYESCTTDGWHTNDLGFFRIAQKLGPVIASIMGIA